MVVNAKEERKQERKTNIVGALRLLDSLQTSFDNAIRKYLDFASFFFFKYDSKPGSVVWCGKSFCIS